MRNQGIGIGPICKGVQGINKYKEWMRIQGINENKGEYTE